MIDLTKQTVYLIAGPARNGKDTIADAIAAVTGLPSSAVSNVIYNRMARDLAASMIWDHNHRCLDGAGRIFGVQESAHQVQWLSQQLEAALKSIPKDVPGTDVGLRPYLISEGNYRTQTDPTHWIRALIENGVRIIPGIRRLGEFEGALREIEEAGGRAVTIWVERPDRERTVKEDNLELHPSKQKFTNAVIMAEGAHTKIGAAAEIIKAVRGESGAVAISVPGSCTGYDKGRKLAEEYGYTQIYNV